MKEPLFAAPPGWTRRRFLKGSAAALAGAYGLSPDFALAEQVPDKFDGLGFKLAAPEPNAKSGGVLRMGIPNRPPHFDIHQSGTFFNLGAQGCMFDNLVRRDPRDGGKRIIPDLAHSWEIAEDGKTYTFFLRKEAQFHDGAELTAEDVKATFDRIARPPSGISIPRSGYGVAGQGLRYCSSPPRKRGSRVSGGALDPWIPALAGMTNTVLSEGEQNV